MFYLLFPYCLCLVTSLEKKLEFAFRDVSIELPWILKIIKEISLFKIIQLILIINPILIRFIIRLRITITIINIRIFIPIKISISNHLRLIITLIIQILMHSEIKDSSSNRTLIHTSPIKTCLNLQTSILTIE